MQGPAQLEEGRRAQARESQLELVRGVTQPRVKGGYQSPHGNADDRLHPNLQSLQTSQHSHVGQASEAPGPQNQADASAAMGAQPRLGM
jgi:hypothetical protein